MSTTALLSFLFGIIYNITELRGINLHVAEEATASVWYYQTEAFASLVTCNSAFSAALIQNLTNYYFQIVTSTAANGKLQEVKIL